ncbi:MAG: acyl carrier protein [Bacteriovoracales bacterium]|nr:acyl carrier protein [Bacteriovoracales bacterium]
MEEKVIDFVCKEMGVDRSKVSSNTSFIDDLGSDSLDMVELMMKMEDEFGIEIPEEEAEKLKTVGDVVAYFKSKP